MIILAISYLRDINSLKIRTVTLLILLHLLCGVLISPDLIKNIFSLALLSYSCWEFYKATKQNIIFWFLSILSGILLYYSMRSLHAEIIYTTIVIFMLYGLYLLFASNQTVNSLKHVNLIFFIPVGISFFANLLTQNPHAIISLIIILQFSDIFAYFGGKYFGSYKIFPATSPNKTAEGLLFSVLGVALALLLNKLYIQSMTQSWWLIAIVILPLFSIASNAGDLIFSKVKRSLKIKDYSDILPGHGGVLDRIDNVIYSSPLMYLLIHTI
ncbi:MAG: phosphatidate cytidylyltransferase [Gammaproteobacteria bacterium]|nr:phosphatidate cytidylyltransferase [Gammaproteobacteria bacterium]